MSRNPEKQGGFMQFINCAHGRRANVRPVHVLDGKDNVITYLVAKRDIAPADETFWEYGATCTRVEEEIKCLCGCRGGYLVKFRG